MFRIWFERPLPAEYASLLDGVYRPAEFYKFVRVPKEK